MSANIRHPVRRVPNDDALFVVPLDVYFIFRLRLINIPFDVTSVSGRLEMYWLWKIEYENSFPTVKWDVTAAEFNDLFKVLSNQISDGGATGYHHFFKFDSNVVLPKNAYSDTHLLAVENGQRANPYHLPNFIRLIATGRPDVCPDFCATDSGKVMRILTWWAQTGWTEYRFINGLEAKLDEAWSALLSAHYSDGLPPDFQPKVVGLHFQNAHLWESYDLTGSDGRQQFQDWLDADAALHWPLVSISPDLLGTVVDITISENERSTFEIPVWLRLAYEKRPDLISTFDLGTEIDRAKFILWWDCVGHKEYGSSLALGAKPQGFGITFDEDTSPVKWLPKLIGVIFAAREDLQSQFRISTAIDVCRLVDWWFDHGYQEYVDYPKLATTAGSKEDWLAPLIKCCVDIDQKTISLSPVIEEIILADASLNKAWKSYSSDQKFKMLSRFSTQIEDAVMNCGQLSDSSRELAIAEFHLKLNMFRQNRQQNLLRPVVGVIGYGGASLGLGEDARVVKAAIEETCYDVELLVPRMPGPHQTLGKDIALTNYDNEVVIFCLPPTDLLRLTLYDKEIFEVRGQYRVALMPWELPFWPLEFADVFNIVDEVWTPSTFNYDCFVKYTDTPIYLMPHGVRPLEAQCNNRGKFGLSKDTFYFYSVFDCNSGYRRKNPLGTVAAFKKAFPSDTTVGLVLKASNGRDNDPNWHDIVAAVGADDRIKILNEDLPRQDLVDLLGSLDCYVSLHRSEGFGRLIAEAMFLGTSVVTSAFSGNMEFCDIQNCLLVKGRLVGLQEGEYLFEEGQYWFEPDIEHAAEQMQHAYLSPDMVKPLVKKARLDMERRHSIGAYAKILRSRLDAIQEGTALG